MPTRRDFLTNLARCSAFLQLSALTKTNKRVAVLDWALMETMVAIGCMPIAGVAISDWNNSGMGPRLPSSVADLGLSPEINFELLAALKPDLILMSRFVESLRPTLERIAPVRNFSVFEHAPVPLSHQRALTRTIGDHLGLSAQTTQYLAAAEHTLDECRARVLARPRSPVLLASFIDARHVRVYGGNGLYANVLNRIGLANSWTGQTSYWGYSTVGIERLATTASLTMIAFDPIPPDALSTLQASPLWTQLPFVKASRLLVLPSVFMFGALPSALHLARLLTDHIDAITAT